jgi:hypothetical protein
MQLGFYLGSPCVTYHFGLIFEILLCMWTSLTANQSVLA